MSFEFEQFLVFIEDNLTSSKDILKLARKRYKDCSAEYRSSESFLDLLQVTESKINSDKKRIFVHLRDFLQALKENVDTCGKRSTKRGLHDGSTCSSEAESDTNPQKRRRTDENIQTNLRRRSRSDNSESDDDSSNHNDVNKDTYDGDSSQQDYQVQATIAENDQESNMSDTGVDNYSLHNDVDDASANIAENRDESDMSDRGDDNDYSSQHNNVDDAKASEAENEKDSHVGDIGDRDTSSPQNDVDNITDDDDKSPRNDAVDFKAVDVISEHGEESPMSDMHDEATNQHDDVDKVTDDNDDDASLHNNVDDATCAVVDNDGVSNMGDLDPGSDSNASHTLVKQGTSKEDNLSDVDDFENDLNSPENLDKTLSKMYSSSEDEDDQDLETTKNITDIIDQDADGNGSENENKCEINDKLNSLGNTDADDLDKVSDTEDIDALEPSCSYSGLTEQSRKNKIENEDKNISDVDNEICDVENKAESDSDEGHDSDSSLEPCSISLTNSEVKSESYKSKNEIEKKEADIPVIVSEKKKLIEQDEREPCNSSGDTKMVKEFAETNTKSNDEPTDPGVESDVVQMIISDSEDDYEDKGSKKERLMLNKTEDFTNRPEEGAGYDADKENKKVTKKRVVTSSDDEDPDYAAKAKKFREKCKKKYVVSTGSKKRANSQQQTKSSPIYSKIDKKEKEKLERSPKKPKMKKKSPSKSSPSKSPILIITDSESSNSEFENCSKKIVKKKIDEKIANNFKDEYDVKVNYPLVVINKVSPRREPPKNEPHSDDQMDTGGSDDGRSITKHSGKFKNGFDDSGEDSDHKTWHRIKTEHKDKIKVKKRVGFITEARYDKDKDSKTSHKLKHSESGVASAFRVKTRDNSESEDNTDRPSARDDVRPGTSARDETESKEDAKKRKASNKQIQKLEKLLEKIRDQIEDVRNRELSVEELDSEVSDYILEDKLQRKFMKVWDKLCELHRAVKTTGRPTDKYFKYQGTRYPDINRKIEKFINKRRTFPDYHDIRNIINKVNKDKRLHLRSREIDDISKEAFTDVGNQLQKRRQKDFISNFHMPGAVNAFSMYDDPALYDTSLKKKLDTNKKQAKQKMEQVVEKYAQMQYQVNDKTDDEESDEEDEEEENADTNAGIEDIDRLMVDNSDSDNNDVEGGDHDGSGHVNTSGDSGPCLEIENLENGQKSRCPPTIPLHKLGQSKQVSEPVIHKHDSPKSQHFADQLGLGVKRKEPDIPIVTADQFGLGVKRKEPDSQHFADQLGLAGVKRKEPPPDITILSDNDDDNQVKCDGNASELEDMECEEEDEEIEDDLEDENDIEDEHEDEEEHKEEHKEADERSKTPVDITIITDDEEEELPEVADAVTDAPLELKISYTRHVSLDDLEKIHKEGISSDDDEPKLDSNKSVNEQVLAHLAESDIQPVEEKLPERTSEPSILVDHCENVETKIITDTRTDTHIAKLKTNSVTGKPSKVDYITGKTLNTDTLKGQVSDNPWKKFDSVKGKVSDNSWKKVDSVKGKVSDNSWKKVDSVTGKVSDNSWKKVDSVKGKVSDNSWKKVDSVTGKTLKTDTVKGKGLNNTWTTESWNLDLLVEKSKPEVICIEIDEDECKVASRSLTPSTSRSEQKQTKTIQTKSQTSPEIVVLDSKQKQTKCASKTIHPKTQSTPEIVVLDSEQKEIECASKTINPKTQATPEIVVLDSEESITPHNHSIFKGSCNSESKASHSDVQSIDLLNESYEECQVIKDSKLVNKDSERTKLELKQIEDCTLLSEDNNIQNMDSAKGHEKVDKIEDKIVLPEDCIEKLDSGNGNKEVEKRVDNSLLHNDSKIENNESENENGEDKEIENSSSLPKDCKIENMDPENNHEEDLENENCNMLSEDHGIQNEDNDCENENHAIENEDSDVKSEDGDVENENSEDEDDDMLSEDNDVENEDGENEEDDVENEKSENNNYEREDDKMLTEDNEIENEIHDDENEDPHVENEEDFVENENSEGENEDNNMLTEDYDTENKSHDIENEVVEHVDADVENVDSESKNEKVEENEEDEILSENQEVEKAHHDNENEYDEVEHGEYENRDYDNGEYDNENEDSEINLEEGEVGNKDADMCSEDNEIEDEDFELNDEEIEVIPDSQLSEVSDDESADSDDILVATPLKNSVPENDILVATPLKNSMPEKCAIPDESGETNDDEDDGEHIAGELDEELVNGGSESIQDIFASYESDSKVECNDDTLCDDEEVLENGGTVPDSCNDAEEEFDEKNENNEDEENDQLNNTSSCDLETIGGLNIKLPNVKDKLLKLGTAISTKPSVTCSTQVHQTQEQSDEIESETNTKCTSRWNDYDENAGLIETYEEPEISVNLRLSQENVIVLSDSE